MLYTSRGFYIMGILSDIEITMQHNDSIINCLDCFINKFRLIGVRADDHTNNMGIQPSRRGTGVKNAFKTSISAFAALPIPEAEHNISDGTAPWYTSISVNPECQTILKSILNLIYVTKLDYDQYNFQTFNDLSIDQHAILSIAFENKLSKALSMFKATSTRISVDFWGNDMFVMIAHDQPRYGLTFTFKREDRCISVN